MPGENESCEVETTHTNTHAHGGGSTHTRQQQKKRTQPDQPTRNPARTSKPFMFMVVPEPWQNASAALVGIMGRSGGDVVNAEPFSGRASQCFRHSAHSPPPLFIASSGARSVDHERPVWRTGDQSPWCGFEFLFFYIVLKTPNTEATGPRPPFLPTLQQAAPPGPPLLTSASAPSTA